MWYKSNPYLPTFVFTPTFDHWWRQMGLDDSALRELEQLILADPESGAVMSGTGGLRKIRFSPKSFRRGKSGGMRVCYAWFDDLEIVFVALAFTKNVKANLTPREKNLYRTWINAVRRELKKDQE